VSRSIRIAVVVIALVALAVPLAASGGATTRNTESRRVLYATDGGGNLLAFRASNPRRVGSKPITGLPAGVSLRGIDFRPATGDLYALGSDKVVYRVNPATAIAVAEGPSFEQPSPVLNGTARGFDFNPTVDKIRVTSDADDNIRLDPDPGSLLSADAKLTLAEVTIVGSAYTASSFSATKPTATELYALDVAPSPDRLWIQRPANAGTLIMPVSLGALDLGPEAGFDIAGSPDVGYVAGTRAGRSGAELWRVELATGKARNLGRIGNGAVTVTGLAAWQDQ
jgi:Domain of unknown function (DUF4394)